MVRTSVVSVSVVDGRSVASSDTTRRCSAPVIGAGRVASTVVIGIASFCYEHWLRSVAVLSLLLVLVACCSLRWSSFAESVPAVSVRSLLPCRIACLAILHTTLAGIVDVRWRTYFGFGICPWLLLRVAFAGSLAEVTI